MRLTLNIESLPPFLVTTLQSSDENGMEGMISFPAYIANNIEAIGIRTPFSTQHLGVSPLEKFGPW